jgi:two-component system response regulator ResD
MGGRPDPPGRPIQRRPCILVVEDEPRIRALIRLYLERAGFDVAEADNGRTALDAFDADPPDLMVVDLLLPGLSGEALIGAIRDVSDIPIIVASAKRADDDRLTAFRLGADDYVTKPFNPVELVARVQAVLRRSRQAADLETGGEPHSYASGRLSIDPALRRYVVDGQDGRLTPTETRLYLALSAAAGTVLDRERLLAVTTRGVSETTRTVDVHVANLRRKLGDHAANAWVIETIQDVGYRWIARRDDSPVPRRAGKDPRQ